MRTLVIGDIHGGLRALHQIFERAKLTKPFSFLMKPFNELEILYALEMAFEKFYEQTNVFMGDDEDTIISTDYLFIKKKL